MRQVVLSVEREQSSCHHGAHRPEGRGKKQQV